MKESKNKALDSALTNMFFCNKYKDFTLFYAHMLAQVKIQKENIPAPAGVSFKLNQYILYINEDLFNEYSLNDQMFILIHEMLHILMGHLSTYRFKKQDESIRDKIKNILRNNEELQNDISKMKFPDIYSLYKFLKYK